jgi:hypothetical protein
MTRPAVEQIRDHIARVGAAAESLDQQAAETAAKAVADREAEQGKGVPGDQASSGS